MSTQIDEQVSIPLVNAAKRLIKLNENDAQRNRDGLQFVKRCTAILFLYTIGVILAIIRSAFWSEFAIHAVVTTVAIIAQFFGCYILIRFYKNQAEIIRNDISDVKCISNQISMLTKDLAPKSKDEQSPNTTDVTDMNISYSDTFSVETDAFEGINELNMSVETKRKGGPRGVFLRAFRKLRKRKNRNGKELNRIQSFGSISSTCKSWSDVFDDTVANGSVGFSKDENKSVNMCIMTENETQNFPVGCEQPETKHQYHRKENLNYFESKRSVSQEQIDIEVLNRSRIDSDTSACVFDEFEISNDDVIQPSPDKVGYFDCLDEFKRNVADVAVPEMVRMMGGEIRCRSFRC